MTTPVPVSLRGLVDVMLARSDDVIPSATALPGGCLYEPKWDGLVAIRRRDVVTLWSRQGKDLTTRFPDLAAAVHTQVAAGMVLDGEVVVWSGDRLSFGLLQARLGASPRAVLRLVTQAPVSFAVFDVLADAGVDVRGLPLNERRVHLERIAATWSPPLNLSPATTSETVAREWFTDLAPAGIEGLVVKGLGQRYRAGGRD